MGRAPSAKPKSTDPGAALPADALFASVYARLKAMAGRQLAAGPSPVSLNTTALVHELYLRMGALDGLKFEQPEQFFAYAARAMRHLLCDRARDRLRQRAGGDWQRITLTGSDQQFSIESAEEALAFDSALEELERNDARAARVIELRYFAGLSPDQIASALGLTRRTIDRDWRFARVFLHDLLG